MSTLWEMATAVTFGYIFMEAVAWVAIQIRKQGEAFLTSKAGC
jgi:hypothetical protein